MTKERNTLMREIVALEAQLNQQKRPRQSKRVESEEDSILNALGALETMVKNACGESFMDMEDNMSYMDEMPIDDMPIEEDFMGYMDEDAGFEEDIVLAEEGGSDYPPVQSGAEDEITQDYLDDVLETEKSPASIVTEPTIQDAAPGGYVARLHRASRRLDKVAAYCEKQGSMKLAYHIDKIADAIDTRIKKEARNV